MSKMSKQSKNSRRWTKRETEPFAEIFGDPDNGFAASTEKMAPKNHPTMKFIAIYRRKFVSL